MGLLPASDLQPAHLGRTQKPSPYSKWLVGLWLSAPSCTGISYQPKAVRGWSQV